MGSTQDMTVRAFLDTSILMLVASGELSLDDLLDELPAQPCIPECVVRELERLATRPGERARRAQWILENVVPRIGVCSERASVDRADECLIELAQRVRGIVVTSDLELAQRARRVGVAVAVFRRARRGLEVLG